MKIIRLFALFLSVLLLVTSCTAAGGGTPDTTVEETLPHDPVDILAEVDGAFVLIRPEKASEGIIAEFLKVRSVISEKYNVTLEPKDDWVNPNKPLHPYEILVGNVDRDETRQVLAEIGTGEYAVRVVGTKIVIVGKTDELTILAAEQFISECLKDGAPSIFTDLMISGKGDFEIEELKIGGVSVDRFNIITPTAPTYNNSAKALVSAIEALCGVTLSVSTSRVEKSDHEIVIGPAGRDANAKTYGYDDTEIYLKDGSLYIGCGSAFSATVGINCLLDMITSAGSSKVAIDADANGSLYSFISGSREEYIKDPTKLQMHWAFTWKPSEELISYENKKAALNCTDKAHLFTVSHRADWIYYPENSIESIISVWAMGGDCVEIDLHFTADGVCVLMHDDTLTRMTNFSEFAGKNGLPQSAAISDWTYEQLMQLNLKEGGGGNGAAVTPYKIPTLEEALTVCKDRLFVILDKANLWRYCEIDGLQNSSQPNYIFPIMEKTGNFESVLISYSDTTGNTLTSAGAMKIQKYVYEKTGQKMFFYLRAWNSNSTCDPYATYLEKNSLSNSGILVDGAYNSNNYYKIQKLTQAHPNTFFGSWTIADETDNSKVWNEMYSIGLRSIMTNNMFALVQFAQEKISK